MRVAVVGAGVWGRQHARAFAARPDTDLVGVFSRSPQRAAARAERYGGTAYTDLDELLRRERPELVSVCLPNEDHYEVTARLVDTGIPLLVEKPLAFELAQAQDLVRRAERRGSFAAIDFNHRYAIPVQLAVTAIADGRLGAVGFTTWRFGGEGGPGRSPYRNLIETQCHGFDLLEHLCGPICSVAAQLTPDRGEGHQTLALALAFESGAVGTMLGTYASSYAYPDACRLEVDGELGRVVVQDTVRRYSFQQRGDSTAHVWQAGYFEDAARSFEQTLDRYLEDMLAAMRSGRAPPVPIRAGHRALVLALAAVESFQSGRTVSVEPPVADSRWAAQPGG